VQEVLENQKSQFPANHIKPGMGKISWFLDRPAAANLRPKRLGLAADHGGYQLKAKLIKKLRVAHYEIVDFGNRKFDPTDDFPDFVIPLARAVAAKQVDRGIAICTSGVGACIVANKIAGARACMIHEEFSAYQGVEDDDMNIICLGSKVLKASQAWELVELFLSARFKNVVRHCRRLAKISALEH
jgi:ribose 5-phosphate isomerase B